MPEQNITSLPNELDFDFEQFVSINENIDCFEPIDANSIIENSNGRRNEISVEEDSLKSFECAEKNNLTRCTNTQEMECLKVLKGFLLENEIEDLNNFNRMERQIESIIMMKKLNSTQVTLMEWFLKK